MFCLASYLFGRRALPDTAVDPEARLPDLAGAVMLAAAMALLSYGIIQIRPWGWSSTGVAAALGASVVLTVALVLRSRHHPAPALPMNLFPIRSFSAANAATTIQSGALSATLLVNVLWLTGGWGYSIFQAGMATLPSPIVVALLAPTMGRLGSRYGVRAIAIPGSLVWMTGVGFYALFVGEEPNFLLHWLPGALLVAVGISMTFPLVTAAAVSDVPPAQFAVAGGVNNVGRQLGATLGVAALVSIIGDGVHLSSFRHAWIAVALAGPLAAGCLLLMPATSGRRLPETPTPTPAPAPPPLPAAERAD